MWLRVNLLFVILFSLSAAFPASDKSSKGGSRSPSPGSSKGPPSQPNTPPQTHPANIPLPPQRGNPNPPPARQEGVWTTDDGVTHTQYGDNPTHGIPLHAQHIEHNYRKHPENNQPFPVNLDGKATKKKLRDSLINNKPEKPGHSRDHKPPNVQVVGGPDRKARTTVQNLPTKESDKEWRLLGKTYAEAIKSNRKPEDGVIHIHAGTGRSRPPSDGSLGGSLHSDDTDSKPQKKPPGPRKPTPPPPSPRKTRSKSKAQAKTNQQKPTWKAGPGAQTPQAKKKQNAPPDAPKKPPTAPLNLTIRPRPQSNSRIPSPVGSDRSQSPPAPAPPPVVAGPSSNIRVFRRPPEPPRTPSPPPRAPSPPSPPSPPGKGKGKMLRRMTI